MINMRSKLKKTIFGVIVSLATIICLSTSSCSAIKKGKIAVKKSIKKEQTGQVEKSNRASDLKQAIVFDCETGDVLFAKNEHEQCVPSSMTKIMTTYIVFEALQSEKLYLDDMAPVSETAKGKEGSRSFFESGTLAKVEDLIRSVVVHSGNDACTVLAEKLCGDEDAFADLMNEKVAEFGLKNTHFTNSTGLPHEEHYSSMYDLAVIAKRLIEDFPQYYHYFSEKMFTINGIAQQNRNTLLGNSLNVDGLKTGRTKAGGFGIIISAQKSGKRLIVVVNGCKSSKSRSVEANKLLGMGFNEYVPLKIADKKIPVGQAQILYGEKSKADLYADDDINISVPKKYRRSLIVELHSDPVEAPIPLGAKLGTLTYRYGDYASKEYALYTHEPIQRDSHFRVLVAKIESFLSSFVSNWRKKSDIKKIEEPIGIGQHSFEKVSGIS